MKLCTGENNRVFEEKPEPNYLPITNTVENKNSKYFKTPHLIPQIHSLTHSTNTRVRESSNQHSVKEG